MLTATWTKLRDGRWGIRGERLIPGDPVRVNRKDGTQSVVIVDEIVWVSTDDYGPDINLCLATVKKASKPRKT